jgi:hypothetical protein
MFQKDEQLKILSDEQASKDELILNKDQELN